MINFDDNVVKVQYINLEKRIDRKEYMEKLLKSCPWPYERFSAVRLSKEPSELGIVVKKGSPGPLAVASIWESHKLVLKKYIECENDGLFITLEDDVIIKDTFWNDPFQYTRGLPDDWNILMFGCRFRKKTEDRKFIPSPLGSLPAPLWQISGDFICTGAHFLVFRNKDVVEKTLQLLDQAVEIEDVDRFFANQEGSFGIADPNVWAGGFGSDHV